MEVLKLKKSNCKNCYKCLRHCPVKTIRFSSNQAHILEEGCILCGQCFVVCPQNAKEVRSDIGQTKALIASGRPVVASVAPSFVANFGVSITAMEKALRQLGFSAVEETALGATLVKQEYDRLIEGREKVMISSCCPTVNQLITKHYPGAIPFLAQVPTPMALHAIDIRGRNQEAEVVFIGPCIAKKAEGDREGLGAVLTFEELSLWLAEEGIPLEQTPDEPQGRARTFPLTGGIISSMDCARKDFDYMKVDGMDNCMAAIEDILAGNLHSCFVEMSACSGSCIGGPLMERKNPIRGYVEVSRYAGAADFDVEGYAGGLTQTFEPNGQVRRPHSQDRIAEVLLQMGKTTPEDELNCGSCGYDSCREKAAAVIDGKAQPSMCLPFLQERSETFSALVVDNSPNGILVLNQDLEIQQINGSALKMMGIKHATEVVGEPVVRLLDPSPFFAMKAQRAFNHETRGYLPEYKKHVVQTVVYQPHYKIYVCILRDVTAEEEEKVKKEARNKQTIETADSVVEKQMRIVQEIASLLGETAAETKIALTKLKGSLEDE